MRRRRKGFQARTSQSRSRGSRRHRRTHQRGWLSWRVRRPPTTDAAWTLYGADPERPNHGPTVPGASNGRADATSRPGASNARAGATPPPGAPRPPAARPTTAAQPARSRAGRPPIPSPVRVSRLRLRWHHWYRGLSWESRIAIIFVTIFAGMTLLPVGVAGIAHHGFAYAETDPQWGRTKDAHWTLTVYHSSSGITQSMQLNDYVLDVLAAEIDPNSPMAALQATAVAVRTYALRAMSNHPPASAHGADLTDSASADLPVKSTTDEQQLYGVAYAADTARLQAAVTSTDGVTLTESGKPILAFITPLSAGQTRNGAKELPSHPPYLPSIDCPADAKARDFNQEFRIPKATVAEKLQVSEKALNLASLQPAGVDNAGYAQTVTDGFGKWTASSFAAALQLPSTHMKFHVDGSILVIQTEGIGSGYGMSLNQAIAYANAGEDWKSILARFYPGAALAEAR